MKQKLTLALLLVSAFNLVQVNAKNGSILNDLGIISNLAQTYKCGSDSIQALQRNLQSNADVAEELLDNALDQAVDCLEACKDKLTAEELQRLAESLEQLYDETEATKGKKRFDNIIVRKQLTAGAVYVGGSQIINQSLTVNGNETIAGSLTIGGNINLAGSIVTSTFQYAVKAQSVGTQALATTLTPVTFPTQSFSSTVGSFNGTTYTAPVTGIYSVNSSLNLSTTGGTAPSYVIAIARGTNGGATTATANNENTINTTSPGAGVINTFEINRIIRLTKGDTLQIQASSPVAGLVNTASNFGIDLVQAL